MITTAVQHSRELERKIEDLERRNRELKSTLDRERETALSSLWEYQTRDKELSTQAKDAEENYQQLQDLFEYVAIFQNPLGTQLSPFPGPFGRN